MILAVQKALPAATVALKYVTNTIMRWDELEPFVMGALPAGNDVYNYPCRRAAHDITPFGGFINIVARWQHQIGAYEISHMFA
jgi:hypothetical protein